MLFSLVNPQGYVVNSHIEFDDPPAISSAKGRWLPDIVPPHDHRLYNPRRIEPVSQTDSSIKYEMVPVSKEVARDVAKSVVNDRKVQEIAAGFEYKGKIIDSTPDSIVRIMGASMAAHVAYTNNSPFAVSWTCADNTSIDLNAEETMNMMVNLVNHINTKHTEARNRKQAIDAVDLTTVSVDDIMSLALV